MSTVSVPVFHYGVLKGYLAGQGAPADVVTSMEALYAAATQTSLMAPALKAIERLTALAERLDAEQVAPPTVAAPTTESPSQESSAEVIELPPLTQRVQEMENEEPPEASPEQQKPKRTCNFSPEARAAAAQRMRDMHARKRAEREAVLTGASNSEKLGPSKPFQPIAPDKLIASHDEYIGRREDGRLVDTDWPDIQKMLDARKVRSEIALQYGVALDSLNFFIAKRLEGKSGDPTDGPEDMPGPNTSDVKKRSWGKWEGSMTQPHGKITTYIDEQGRKVTRCPPGYASGAYTGTTAKAKEGD